MLFKYGFLIAIFDTEDPTILKCHSTFWPSTFWPDTSSTSYMYLSKITNSFGRLINFLKSFWMSRGNLCPKSTPISNNNSTAQMALAILFKIFYLILYEATRECKFYGYFLRNNIGPVLNSVQMTFVFWNDARLAYTTVVFATARLLRCSPAISLLLRYAFWVFKICTLTYKKKYICHFY